jgi:ribosomal protein L32
MDELEENMEAVRKYYRPVKPWDLLDPRQPRTEQELKEARLRICESCEFFKQASRKCSKCGCFMDLKTTLNRARCPVDKW